MLIFGHYIDHIATHGIKKRQKSHLHLLVLTLEKENSRQVLFHSQSLAKSEKNIGFGVIA